MNYRNAKFHELVELMVDNLNIIVLFNLGKLNIRHSLGFKLSNIDYPV